LFSFRNQNQFAVFVKKGKIFGIVEFKGFLAVGNFVENVDNYLNYFLQSKLCKPFLMITKKLFCLK